MESYLTQDVISIGRLSETDEYDDSVSDNADPSPASMATHYSHVSVESQRLALQELKEEDFEMNVQKQKLQQKYNKARELAHSKYFESMQLLNQLFAKHTENLEISYQNKLDLFQTRQKQIQNTFQIISKSSINSSSSNNTHLKSQTMDQLQFDPLDPTSLFSEMLSEDGNNSSGFYDVENIENFEFPKLKKLTRVMKQLETMNNHLKLDNALIKLKNNENTQLHLQRERETLTNERKCNSRSVDLTAHRGRSRKNLVAGSDCDDTRKQVANGANTAPTGVIATVKAKLETQTAETKLAKNAEIVAENSGNVSSIKSMWEVKLRLKKEKEEQENERLQRNSKDKFEF